MCKEFNLSENRKSFNKKEDTRAGLDFVRVVTLAGDDLI